MIRPGVLHRYLLLEGFASWAGVTTVLLAIMLSTRFARFLADAAAGKLPREFLLNIAGLSSLQYLVILIPVSLLLALATYENVSIVSSPKIAVREGVRAQFVNTVSIPSLNVSGISAEGKYSAAVKYDEVGIKLYVIPRVVGTQTVGLNIDIEASAQAGSAVTFTVQGSDPSSPGPTISNPIISKRAAQTVVYLEPGQAVILGGLVSERKVDAESKVPLLGDLPVLGYLFKSTKKRKEKTNVLFFIRPRILQGTDLNREF
jgi:type II secretory pathway component GspD/PulD (secretin)